MRRFYLQFLIFLDILYLIPEWFTIKVKISKNTHRLPETEGHPILR